MKIQEIFDLALRMGKSADPRPQEVIEKQLKRFEHNYNKLSEKEKEVYPIEKLTNPYVDSAIHFLDPDKEIKKILVAIDATEAKVLLAKQLDVDLVIGHHPIGKSLAMLGEAMKMQVYFFEKHGVPLNAIEALMKERISEVNRSVHAFNHYREIDMAKLLRINLMNIHTPSDNLVYKFLTDYIERNNPEYLEDILNLLLELPEGKEAARRGTSPTLFSGESSNLCGKTIVDVTGGTNTAQKVYQYLTNAGIGTVITEHQPEKHREEAIKSFTNVVIAPHIAFDSLGMNLFVDELEKRGIEILAAGGFIRVSRVNNPDGEIVNAIQ